MGRVLRIGDNMALKLLTPTMRCVMITLAHSRNQRIRCVRDMTRRLQQLLHVAAKAAVVSSSVVGCGSELPRHEDELPLTLARVTQPLPGEERLDSEDGWLDLACGTMRLSEREPLRLPRGGDFASLQGHIRDTPRVIFERGTPCDQNSQPDACTERLKAVRVPPAGTVDAYSMIVGKDGVFQRAFTRGAVLSMLGDIDTATEALLLLGFESRH